MGKIRGKKIDIGNHRCVQGYPRTDQDWIYNFMPSTLIPTSKASNFMNTLIFSTSVKKLRAALALFQKKGCKFTINPHIPKYGDQCGLNTSICDMNTIVRKKLRHPQTAQFIPKFCFRDVKVGSWKRENLIESWSYWLSSQEEYVSLIQGHKLQAQIKLNLSIQIRHHVQLQNPEMNSPSFTKPRYWKSQVPPTRFHSVGT